METTRIDQNHLVQFDGLGDLANEAEKRIQSGGWTSSSIEQSEHRTEFTGVDSLETAIQMARTGWREGSARLISGLDSHAPAAPDVAPAWEYDVGGEIPDVAAYCAGVPEHMASPADPDRSGLATAPRIVVDGFYPAKMPAEAAERYAVALASHIQAISANGRGVDMEVSGMVEQEGKRVGVRIPITTAGAPLDLDRIAFALHPALLRRLMFAILESRSDFAFLGGSFGFPERPGAWMLPDVDAVIPSPWEAYTEGAAETVESLADWMARHLEEGGVIVRDSPAAA